MRILSVFFIILLFIAGCGDDPDVVNLDSGLKYADDSLGTGNAVKSGDIVTLHYSAWIIKDSTKLYSDWTNDTTGMGINIGSSKAFNQPIKFKVDGGQFIKGSDEGIKGMKPGGKRTLIIPSYLAYGNQGFGPVPPNSNLKVVIELVSTRQPVQAKLWNVDTTKATTTATGLKYISVQEGSGDRPDSGDVVAVHYTGYLQNGKKFDSSVERDEPIVFTIGRRQVIPGWDEGIALIKEGGKARLIIPPSLAYGAQGSGPIPPNSTLLFDIELVDVK